MDKRIISNWVRQARYRAKANELHSDLQIEDVQNIIDSFEGRCAYCGVLAETLDHPFPLKSNAPNIPSNVLPICRSCKGVKKNHDMVWMYNNEHLQQGDYLKIVKFLLSQRGKDAIKVHIRRATGMISD